MFADPGLCLVVGVLYKLVRLSLTFFLFFLSPFLKMLLNMSGGDVGCRLYFPKLDHSLASGQRQQS